MCGTRFSHGTPQQDTKPHRKHLPFLIFFEPKLSFPSLVRNFSALWDCGLKLLCWNKYITFCSGRNRGGRREREREQWPKLVLLQSSLYPWKFLYNSFISCMVLPAPLTLHAEFPLTGKYCTYLHGRKLPAKTYLFVYMR